MCKLCNGTGILTVWQKDAIKKGHDNLYEYAYRCQCNLGATVDLPGFEGMIKTKNDKHYASNVDISKIKW